MSVYPKKEHKTNENVKATIQQMVGRQEELLTTIKRRKLAWYYQRLSSSVP